MYRRSLRNCMTFFPSRANAAQREVVLGFCSSPRSVFASNLKLTSRNLDRLVRCTGKLPLSTVTDLASLTKAWRHTEIKVSSKLAAIVYHPLNLRMCHQCFA